MSDSFAKLFEESLAKIDLRPGMLVKATVVEVRSDRITVDAGLKSEGIIPAKEFRNEEIAVGDEVEVVVRKPENGFGETVLSREEARRAQSWRTLESSHESGESVMGVIIERVKGGFTVEVDSVRAFLPGSLVDVKPVRDPGYLEGKELEFKIIKMDQKRNNIVVSRRAVMEDENSAERQSRIEELVEGQEMMGIVKNITDYGAFIDLGGIDGLLHITDMAWRRIKHPSELLNVGDELRVKILKFDREKQRVSLGLKQLGEDPWVNIAERYPIGAKLEGKITNVTDYGCFVQLEEGVEGLVHMSEMDWTNKNVHPSKVVQSGDEVQVVVLEINEERRRISLGIKQCKVNPWNDFAAQHEKGDTISGKIRSITDFGIFIGLDGDIDGLVHLSDISWTKTGEDAVREYQKGQEVEAIILAIDADRERISLGIKQLDADPVSDYMEKQGDKDPVINAAVQRVDMKEAIVQLEDGITGLLKVADYSYEHIDDLRDVLKEGDSLDVKIINTDRKTRQILVSHKALDGRGEASEQARMDSVPTKTTLGDLLKEQMNKNDD